MDRLTQNLKKYFGIAAIPITWQWQSYSRLILVGSGRNWVLDHEMQELAKTAQTLGIHVIDRRWRHMSRQQAVFYAEHHFLMHEGWQRSRHRLGTSYFHGLPGSGIPEFDAAYRNLQRHHQAITRIQVSHTEMRDVILESGIDPTKVFLIPIGINIGLFNMQTSKMRQEVRHKYGIPTSATVVGSFQKDGVGWADGSEPKLIKGPDVFLRVIERLRTQIPELFVLLSGPARGYVIKGLEQLAVPYRHLYLSTYPEISQLFQALDLYLITSRQEGGPKAVLESMASGVPLVSTRVGQAMDLVRHGHNGWLTEVEDIDGLVHWSKQALDSSSTVLEPILGEARQTAEQNDYRTQLFLWHNFLQGFVEW